MNQRTANTRRKRRARGFAWIYPDINGHSTVQYSLLDRTCDLRAHPAAMKRMKPQPPALIRVVGLD